MTNLDNIDFIKQCLLKNKANLHEINWDIHQIYKIFEINN